MKRKSLEKFVFVAGLVCLAFLLGFVVHWANVFPSQLLSDGLAQLRAVGAPPHQAHPRVYDEVGVRQKKSDRLQPGLTLVLGLWKEFEFGPGARLIDADGETIHSWNLDPHVLFPEDLPAERTARGLEENNVHGSYLFDDGDLLVNLSYVGTARVSACGDVEWRLLVGSHHSIERDDDGTFWITGGSWKPPETGRKEFPGLSPPLYHDRVLNVSETGEVLRELDVIQLLYANDLQHYFVKGSHWTATSHRKGDVTHLNDIEPLPASLADEYPLFEAGDLALSLHHLDLVLVFDPDTMRVKWHSAGFIQQHDVDFLGDGWIGVFDNRRDGTPRGSMLGGSRIVAVRPHTGEREILFPTPNSDPFYTSVQGEWQQLANGNLLLTESEAGRVVEVTPDGRTVWDWVEEPYGETQVLEMSDAIRYDLTPEQVARWPCAGGPAPDR